MKKVFLILIMFTCATGLTQETTAAVVSVYTNGAKISPSAAESLLRIELTKTNTHRVFDKLDMLEIAEEKEIKMTDCFGRKCLLRVGQEAEVDKVFTGTIENLGKKIIVSIRIIDVATGNYDNTVLNEFLALEEELQLMVQITLNDALNIENNKDLVSKLKYSMEPLQAPTTSINNNGPRMGVAYAGGETGKALIAPKDEGGYEAFPVVSQFGYQFEKAYLSSGNFQALVEGLVLMTGLEQGLFNPSITFMNGFRSSKTGLEFAFGPSIRLATVKDGYYFNEGEGFDNKWHSENDWYNETNLVVDTILGYSEYIENPNRVFERADSRGSTIVTTNWVWAIGKTFHSGYLNIPVNVYFSHGKYSWFAGASVGFNLSQATRK